MSRIAQNPQTLQLAIFTGLIQIGLPNSQKQNYFQVKNIFDIPKQRSKTFNLKQSPEKSLSIIIFF